AGDLVWFDETKLELAFAGEGLRYVKIGREVVPLRHDDITTMAIRPARARERERGAERPEHVDRSAIGNDELADSRDDEPRDLVAHTLREVDPSRGIPAADQPAAPLVAGDLAQPRGGAPRKRAKRIAVEVDHARRQLEEIAQRRQWVAGIQMETVRAGGHRPRLMKSSTARSERRARVLRSPCRR